MTTPTPESLPTHRLAPVMAAIVTALVLMTAALVLGAALAAHPSLTA